MITDSEYQLQSSISTTAMQSLNEVTAKLTNDDDDGSLSVATNPLEEEDHRDFSMGDHDDTYNSDELPLWYYHRAQKSQHGTTTGSIGNDANNLPCCTTSVMGKVVLNATTSVWTPIASTAIAAAATTVQPSSSISTTKYNAMVHDGSLSAHDNHDEDARMLEEEEGGGDISTTANNHHSDTTPLLPQHTWYNQTIFIVVCGYSNGQVSLYEATTNAAIVDTSSTSAATATNEHTPNAPASSTTSNNTRSPDVTNSSDTNNSVINETGWYVTTSSEKKLPIVSVSIDATGTVVTAIDTDGNCSIWTIKYSIQYEPESINTSSSSSSSAQSLPTTLKVPTPSGNLLTKLFWRNTTSTAATTTTNEDSTTTTMNMETPKRNVIPTLAIVDVKVTRIPPYNESIYGKPTCICLDPQFGVGSSFRFIVTFTSGKIVMTSRNWMRRYEEHTILPYFNSASPKETYIGIETIVWRSTMIAFADFSGISLYDIQSFKPIARVDRPIGAQPSLYHFMNPFRSNNNNKTRSQDDNMTLFDPETTSINDESHTGTNSAVPRIRPHLFFETSRSLLVAWGDCLMTLSITDTTANVVDQQSIRTTDNVTLETTSTSAATRVVPPSSNSTISAVRKRSVACTMAWALDGVVAADVVPIDERHIAVLGYVLADDNDDGDEAISIQIFKKSGNNSNLRTIENPYEMELQILDRTNGSILHSDLLQLQRPNVSSTSLQIRSNYNQNCRLLSTFAVPRMDDVVELKEGRGDHVVDMILTTPKFLDSHFRWSLNAVAFPTSMSNQQNNKDVMKYEVDDTDSVDSDEYGFLASATNSTKSEPSIHSTVSPPTLLVVSDIDTVVARVRDVDDAIHFALEHRRPALALFWAFTYRTHQLRRYTMDDLINIYLRSLLRITGVNTSPIGKEQNSVKGARKLSLRRMTLAAQSLPILLGGNVAMWKTWIIALEKIPGALFVVRKYIPVRDPKLPKMLYARVLRKMLEEVETMRLSFKPDATNQLIVEAEGHFLSTLLAWGTTRSLNEHLKLYKYQANLDSSHDIEVHRTIESLRFRYEQSAVGYLDPSSTANSFERPVGPDIHFVNTSDTPDVFDALYNTDDILAVLAQRISIIGYNPSGIEKEITRSESDSRVAIDGIARIHMMNNSYNEALKCFLVLSALHSMNSLDDVEQDALSIVNETGKVTDRKSGAFSFVLHLIEVHHLYQCLLEINFLPKGINCSPICALIRMVGLDLAGDFLMQNCSAPQQAASIKTDGERRGTLPLDLVADQLSGNPKLFHWYLHVLSMQRPELYLKFPTTANPPPVITTLHKKHLDLYIRYAGPNRDSTKVLANVEAYLVSERTTPLLSFLKFVLQLGTIGAIEVAKLLEIERRGGAGVSHTFALELAYILENHGNSNETDALLILELFLEGAQSLMLAVSFAQRTKSYSTKLWEKLISHCLLKSSVEKTSDGSFSGTLFGSLLEAAALAGADLSHLVAQIPKGMQVEGLRPRLIAAVADYRLKLQLHSKSNEIANVERRALFVESSRRYRRGMRYEHSSDTASNSSYDNTITTNNIGLSNEVTTESPYMFSTELRPRNRLNRYSHSMQLPIR